MASTATNLWVLLGLSVAGILLVARRLRKVIKPDFGSFIERFELLPPPPPAPPKAPHPLSGLSFAVADVFDIKEHVTGFGVPKWSETHESAEWTSPTVSVLINGGATCVGKTVVDEMGYSINGENKHFGAPTNPAALDRISGGSCSGSAVAVAAGLVDFSLGVDAIGGIRLPAAYCGILGFRPSYGAIANIGILPVSPSLDTIGFFARDQNVMHRVGHILLKLPYSDKRQPRQIIIADDCFDLLKIPKARISQVVIKSTEKLFGRQLLNHTNLGDYLTAKVSILKHLNDGSKSSVKNAKSLASLGNAMRLLHRHEFKNIHGEWIQTAELTGSFIANEMSSLLEPSASYIEHCQSARNQVRAALNALLKLAWCLILQK